MALSLGQDARSLHRAEVTKTFFIDDRLVPEREDLFTYCAGHDEGQRLFRSSPRPRVASYARAAVAAAAIAPSWD